MNAIKLAIADAVLTFLWVLLASTFGAVTTIVATALGLESSQITNLSITTFLIFSLVFVFNLIGDALGGASFNPVGSASFYAAGVGSDTLFSMALRFPAQTAGAIGGALAIMELMPANYKHMLEGPSLKVDLHTGAIAEGVLTFVITFAVLLILLRGPRSNVFKAFLLAVSTIALVVSGANYTGPSMNPAIAFGWAYVNGQHNTWEQFYVYWICPFVGAILAAWFFRVIFPPPSPSPSKQKEA